MDERTLRHFKELFLVMRNKHMQLNYNVENEFSEKGGDDVDLSNNERDLQLKLRLQGRRDLFLKKIDAALDRIDNGTFGECTECGVEISKSRLFARPTTTECIDCKEEKELSKRHVPYERKSHTHGKQLGGNVVSIERDRKNYEGNVLNFNKKVEKMLNI